jgi:hypothetical protein
MGAANGNLKNRQSKRRQTSRSGLGQPTARLRNSCNSCFTSRALPASRADNATRFPLSQFQRRLFGLYRATAAFTDDLHKNLIAALRRYLDHAFEHTARRWRNLRFDRLVSLGFFKSHFVLHANRGVILACIVRLAGAAFQRRSLVPSWTDPGFRQPHIFSTGFAAQTTRTSHLSS